MTASRRGQDKRGRRRSAAIPRSQLLWENAITTTIRKTIMIKIIIIRRRRIVIVIVKVVI